MEPLRIFDNFKLDDLNDEWVQSIWDKEFLTFDNVPDEYLIYLNSEDMGILLKESYDIVKEWISGYMHEDEIEDQRSEVSWQTFVALNINPRSLLAVLGYMIKNGQGDGVDEDSRQACLRATSLYFTLLAVPGSNVFHVFHPNLYHRAIETFKLAQRLMDKSKKRSRTLDLESLYETEEETTDTLVHTEKVILTKGLNSVMYDLIMMLKLFCMRDHARSLEITVHSLLEVAKLETGVNHFESSNRAKEASLTSLSYNAYVALQELCNLKHGPVNVTVRLIAKYLLPNFLINCTDLPTKSLLIIRETMVNFLMNLLETHKQQAELGVTTLIEHLMVKYPERVEARQRQATIITKLINLSNSNIFIKAIENLILLAHHNKVTCRIFAQEVIRKFLFETTPDIEKLSEACLALRTKVRKLLIATVLCRCVDSSNLVRGKAMATIAEYTDPQNDDVVLIQEAFKASNQDKLFPTLEQLREAISEDIDPLPGSNVIVPMFIARVEDERALVRRDALQILQNLTILFPELLNKVTSVMELHCRDPALSVRRFAIQILMQLVEKFPDHPTLLKTWVQAVLPRIFDIEAKVQDKVLESLQHLMLNKISRFSNSNNNTLHNLPWQILNLLTQMKMRKHLSKVCSIWQQNNVITKSLINSIQSHLGTNNNVAAWILLAAFAENTNLPDMTLHFANYKELVQSDTFLATLILEVLRNSWSSLDRKFLRNLHLDLFECLCKFQVSVRSIGICLDILDRIIRHLHPDNGDQLVQTSALDLMKLSEAQLDKIFQSESQAAEAAVVYLKAMCTLGHAASLCTGTISSSTLRILQGLLLEWDMLPVALRHAKELQAAAIVVLGQHAIRNREVAQEVTPILGRLMCQVTDVNSKTEAVVRVNAAKTLADLCITFTALVEPYLPDMCISMKDPNPIVREVIMILFIQLLLEDFIQVKGPFFFHILTMLTDTDISIRELTVFLIKERLLVKNKTLISQQFLKSILHYNNYRFNKFYNQRMREKEKTVLTLPGQRNQEKRRTIYNFMLEHLDPAQKLKLLVRLTGEILNEVSNDSIDIELEEGMFVLKDTLYIMTTDHFQPSFCNKQGDDDSQDENTSLPSVPPSNIAANVIMDGMKKHGLEVLLPILVKLKRKLTASQSPLVVRVRKLLVKVISDYNKEQLSNLYSEYPDLEREIHQDIRKYGKNVQSDMEDIDEESNPLSVQSSQKQRSSINLMAMGKRMPKIVLRRLSSLTYSGISNLRSPSQSSNFSGQSPQLRLSSREQFLTSPSPTSRSNLLLAEPGPSNSTPKSSRTNSFRLPHHSPIFSLNSHLLKSQTNRRLQNIFNDEDSMQDYSKETVFEDDSD